MEESQQHSMRLAVCLTAAAVLLAGCGGGSSAELETSTGAPMMAPSEEPRSFLSAGGSAELVEALAKRIPTVMLTTAFTEDNDPNNQLGRPGGYIGKASFSDSRVKPDDRNPDADDIANGGSVEVFTSEADARGRKKYIENILKGAGGMLGTEYLHVSKGALLRVSGNLTPTMDRKYEAVWSEVVTEAIG